LHAQDIALLRESPVISITYLPYTRLDETMIVKRFGQASQKITEQDSVMVHWLYPELGLDIALNSDGTAVLQYTSPDRFSELKAPLTQRR
jgi:translation initiation factor 2 beta subunit (eIF-2beta)/eIF-5